MTINNRRRGRFSKKKVMFFGFFIWSLCLVSGILLLKYYFLNREIISPLADKIKENIQITNSANELEQILKKNNVSFGSVSNFSGSSLIVKMNGEEKVIFSTKKPFQEQVSSLQFILSRLTIEGKRFTRLDLRYDDPVISFK